MERYLPTNRKREANGNRNNWINKWNNIQVIDVTPTAVILSSDSLAGLTADNGR
ncbi:hypothetical protein [Clostridium saccharobutylicum]|uniref:hypothetical protein n=1 Tax=Clostridium saccharobutylicum TaxID=169679 RepID=UPI0017F3A14E|nr:hypothetical protein [Clostridium saccharobutylicum]